MNGINHLKSKRSDVGQARTESPAFRRNPDQAPIGFVRDDPQRTIRSHFHITHALAMLQQQALFARYPIAVKRQSRQMPTGQRCDEEIAFPFGDQIAVIESDARWRDALIPVVFGLLGARATGPLTVNRFAGVMGAIRHQWPSIVAAWFDHIDLVATLRSMVADPKLARPGLVSQSLRIPVPIVQMRGSAPITWAKGLSSGMLPSRLMRRIFPIGEPGFCAASMV